MTDDIQAACQHCRFATLEQMQGQIQRMLVCHRFPPTPYTVPQPRGVAMMCSQPIVQPNMFCYEFQPAAKISGELKSPEKLIASESPAD